MKTHLLLPFPVSYVGDCVRTAPYTHPDHARCGRGPGTAARAAHGGQSQAAARGRGG